MTSPTAQQETDEWRLRQVRQLLGTAHELEVQGLIERADAFGAMAANKLALVVHRERIVHHYNFRR